MPNNNKFQTDWVSPPGNTIMDILGERELSLHGFAELTGYDYRDAQKIVDGQLGINEEIATVLARILGATKRFWLERELQYRDDIQRIGDQVTLESKSQWLNELPLKDMIRFGWIHVGPYVQDRYEACLRFFDVLSIKDWHKRYTSTLESVTYKQSPSFVSLFGATATWLRQAELEAEAINCNAWNARRFREKLHEIRALTRRKDPEHFLPELRALCAECGVAVVILQTPEGCRASGATKFLSSDKALIILSFRYLSDDHFWFAFFHEAGHLLLHGENSIFIEGMELAVSGMEQEANSFAFDILIPKEYQTTLLNLPAIHKEVIRYAVKIGISPGIVVGQLQYHNKITHRHLNRLKRFFTWKVG